MNDLETELRETLTDLAPDDVDLTGWSGGARARSATVRRRRIAAGVALVAVVGGGVVAADALERGSGRETLPMRPDPSATTATDTLPDPSSRIAYQAIDGASGRVHVSRVDGSDDVEVAQLVGGDTGHPDFSPDGSRLAFDQLGSDRAADQVYVSDADGSSPQLVTACLPPECLGHTEPSWSPDGQRLAVSFATGPVSRAGPSSIGLAVIDVRTQQVTPVLTHPAADGQDHDARWSPDGAALVFWRERTAPDGSTQTAVFRVGVSGQGLRQLTPWSLVAGDPDWSPDGTSIVFATRPLMLFPYQGQSELYVVDADGTGMRQVTHNGPYGPRAGYPRWAPDGRSIVYVRAHSVGWPMHVYSIAADGSQDGALLYTRDEYREPVLRPGG